MERILSIQTALVSVYNKEGLEPVLRKLDQLGVKFISTGGTLGFIESLGLKAEPVESLTSYPSIFGGRVKTLHPAIFGGILHRRGNQSDLEEKKKHNIPAIDLVIVDLYPFRETLASTEDADEIIEKIDIGGISLIRAGAKNFQDVMICSNRNLYQPLLEILEANGGATTLEQRKKFATHAFLTSSEYDSEIAAYFNREAELPVLQVNHSFPKNLRYGENPHQKGRFFGRLDEILEQIHGKEISYNNLLDIEAAVVLMQDFSAPGFAILKHNNACGMACDENLKSAYLKALAGDPVSAFGGVLITNGKVDVATAEEMNKLFFEVCIAPDYDAQALEILREKKNRVILVQKPVKLPAVQFRTLLNGIIEQERDTAVEQADQLRMVTEIKPDETTLQDLLFAAKLVKHTKSNAIVLAKNNQLLGIGTGHTSRVDALRHAISKAEEAGLSLQGSVMASDAFFPFPDCVEIAHAAGIKSVIQPGGSIKDQDSIDACNRLKMSMVLTGIRHFKH